MNVGFIKIIIFTLLYCLKTLSVTGQNDISITASGKVIHGTAGIYYGISFSLVNVETGTIYFSELLSVFKQRFSIIENLPPGKYQMFYFGGSTGITSIDNPLHQYFGYFEFEFGRSYYLGSFVGKIKAGWNKPIVYTIKNEDIPWKVVKTLKKREIIEKDEHVVKTYPYNSDTLIIPDELKIVQYHRRK